MFELIKNNSYINVTADSFVGVKVTIYLVIFTVLIIIFPAKVYKFISPE